MDGISVVIPCYNEETYIASCIEGILNNGFPLSKMEVLVVDGGSTDGTSNILDKYVNEYKCVKIINNERKKTPFALNLGIHNACFSYVLIAGAHADYPQNYLTKLYNHIQHEDVDVIGGALETRTKILNDKTKAICKVLSHPLGVGNSTFRTGARALQEVDTVPFGLYNKQVFVKAGTYNERLIRNHDMELSSRIKAKGFRIWLDPKLKCVYYARETYKQLAINNYANGLWNLKTVAITKKFSSLSLRHFIPLIFLLSLILPVLLSPFTGLWMICLSLLSLILYLLLITFFSMKLKTRFVYTFITFITLHFSYGIGSFAGMLSLLKPN